MIKLKDWNTEKSKCFSNEDDARVWLLGQLVVRYMLRISDESVKLLASRMGLEMNVEENKEVFSRG